MNNLLDGLEVPSVRSNDWQLAQLKLTSHSCFLSPMWRFLQHRLLKPFGSHSAERKKWQLSGGEASASPWTKHVRLEKPRRDPFGRQKLSHSCTVAITNKCPPSGFVISWQLVTSNHYTLLESVFAGTPNPVLLAGNWKSKPNLASFHTRPSR